MIHLDNKYTYFIQKRYNLIDYHVKMKLRAGWGALGQEGQF